MEELERYLDFARGVVYEAGRLTLGYFYRGLEIIDKADGSPVTVADREAETHIRAAIEKAFPDHGIYGEEHGVKEPRNGCAYTWYIDPIDGTKSFIHGVPLYSNLIGLMRDDENVVGMIQLPALGEQLCAAKGLGTRLNGRLVRVSDVADLSRAVMIATDHREMETDAPHPGWRKLWEGCRFNRSWGDAYGYYLVASGRAEIMMDPIVAPYDVAPLPVIMREAGGSFTDWKGKESIQSLNGFAVNAALKDTVYKALEISD